MYQSSLTSSALTFPSHNHSPIFYYHQPYPLSAYLFSALPDMPCISCTTSPWSTNFNFNISFNPYITPSHSFFYHYPHLLNALPDMPCISCTTSPWCTTSGGSETCMLVWFGFFTIHQLFVSYNTSHIKGENICHTSIGFFFFSLFFSI